MEIIYLKNRNLKYIFITFSDIFLLINFKTEILRQLRSTQGAMQIIMGYFSFKSFSNWFVK